MSSHVLLLLLCTFADEPSASAVLRPFAGSWTGTLEYRDYSSDARSTLPTTVSSRLESEGKSLALDFVYDEGNGQSVKNEDRIRIDLGAKTFDWGPRDKPGKVNHYTVTGFDELAAQGSGKLILTGTGEENGKPVAVRETITLTAKELTILKETGPKDGKLIFRNQYKLKRTE
jgi:hypothetical protein